MLTIKDVAREAGVSTATVSRVLCGKGKVGDKCRAHVQKVIKDLGYRPNTSARALATKRTHTIGIITPSISTLFFCGFIQGAEIVSRQAQYKLMIASYADSADSEREAIESLRESGYNNIVLHSKYLSDEELVKLAKEIKGLVFINRLIPALANRCVWLDNITGGAIAAEYLLKQGHRDIAIITSKFSQQDYLDRIHGAEQALAKQGLTIHPDNIIYFNPLTDITEQPDSLAGATRAGKIAVQKLLQTGQKFTAILAYNDHMAIGAMLQLQENGIKVPEDVSIIGFDDIFISTLCSPLLTSMKYPITKMGEDACQLSIQLTDEKVKLSPKTHLFIPSLTVRNSVSSLKK